MLLTLGSFLCDTWTLAPVNPLRELDMGSSLCFPMGGHTTRAPLWPSLIPCNLTVQPAVEQAGTEGNKEEEGERK